MNEKNSVALPQIKVDGVSKTITSLTIIIIIPMVLFSIYTAFFAVRVYEAEASMAVRKEAVVSQDSVGVSLGSSSALAIYADSFIVARYAKSHKAIEAIMKDIDVIDIFSKGNSDPYYAFPRKSSYLLPVDVTIEGIVSYWQGMIDADFDASTGIIELRVRAFTPEDALKLANSLTDKLTELVTKLSEKSQREAIRFAEVIIKEKLDELENRRKAVLNFRLENEIFDPSSEVANLNALITTLSQELVKLKTERAVMRATSINNPKIMQLDIKITNTLSLLQEIKQGHGDFEYVGKLPKLLRRYELLKTNFDIANQQYIKSLEQFTDANASAVLRQAHLYVFVPFSKPDAAIRPDMLDDLLTALLILACMWGIYRLVV